MTADQFPNPFRAIFMYLFLVFGVAFIIMIAGCGSAPPSEPVVKKPPPVTIGPSFKTLRAGALGTYCLKCHLGGSRDLGTYAGAMQYVVAGKPDASKLCQVVKDGSMPLGGKMPAESIKEICEWISAGAIES